MAKIQVNFCYEIYGSEMTKKKKIYNTEGIAKRYINKWMDDNASYYYCRTYNFETEKWSLIQRVG